VSDNSDTAVSHTVRRVTLTQADLADGDDDPLAPESANLTGALIGYARVSTAEQILDRQTRTLTEADHFKGRRSRARHRQLRRDDFRPRHDSHLTLTISPKRQLG
jgi:hypothetical protein